jgi:uncharacterized protein (TIGR00255 family)
MSVRSMTGFARVAKAFDGGEAVVSLKSVNHRGLDLHFRLPSELDGLEGDIRAILKGGMARGHVQVNVEIHRTAAGAGAGLNRPLLDAYMQAFREAAALYQADARPDINAALRVPGMLTGGETAELPEELAKTVLAATGEALALLNESREREGAATAEEMRRRCENIRGLTARMEEIRAGAVPAFHQRLKERLGELLNGAGLEPQRLAQEAAVLADRSDICEELVRLRTHAAQLDAILDRGGEVGKQLDFLLQEMNRESNTSLSKTGGLGDLGLTLTELGLASKSEIDKIREQSLNLE